MISPRSITRWGTLLLGIGGVTSPNALPGQEVRIGSPVGAEVRTLYEKGLGYLASIQEDSGSFGNGAGITGICLMAFLASGEDPNFGRYSENVQGAVRSLLAEQNAATGYLGNSMYHHGFATLALAESYGAVDETLLWGGRTPIRSIGESLELAVRCAVTSQEQNPFHAWRYAPDARDADTSVSGAVLMGLLAARNAGIEVPDVAIDQAVEYFASMTTSDGSVGYSAFGGGESLNRSAIATLIFAVAKRKQLPGFAATLGFLRDRIDYESSYHPYYFRYYMAQAIFQGDFELWRGWSRENTLRLLDWQRVGGEIVGPFGQGQGGDAYTTGMLLLSVALEYCFLPIYER